jgi:alkylation response protein AidB-like acyl-CoA dehydrogenase
VELEITPSQRNLFDGFVRQGCAVMAAPENRNAAPSRARWDAVRATGLAGFAAPVNLGGRGISGSVDLALAMQALSYACTDATAILTLSCHLFGGVLPLSRHGTSEQQATWLPRLVSGEYYAARTLLGSMEAERTEGGFRLSGATEIASAGIKPDLAIVFAQASGSSESSVHAFLVPLAGTGTWEHSSGSALARADSLRLENTMVPDGMVLCTTAGDVLLPDLLSREQLGLHAARLGLLQRLLETVLESARKYTRRLKLKGVPPHHYQMLGHKLADFRVRFDAAELLLRRAAWEQERRDATTDVALAGLALDISLPPAAFEVVKLQHDYALDPDRAWTGLLTDAVEYGRFLCNPGQMRATVNASLRAGTA